MITFFMTKRQGGKKSKRNPLFPTEKEIIEKMKYGLHLVLYQDHIVYKNTTPESIVLSQRVAIGWLHEETSEYVHLVWDRPTWLQKYEKYDPMSGIKILKSSIQERKFLH